MATGMRYMFVECQTPEKAKLRNTRGSKSAARAHVTKEFHRKVRQKRRDDFTAEVKEEPLVSPVSKPAPTPLIVKIKSEVLEEDDEPLEEIPPQPRDRSPSISNPVAWSVIQSSLSQSRTDPFNNFPEHDMSPFLQRVLDHALVHTWPSTIPVKGSNSLENPINAAWLQSCMQFPVVFHAFLYAASLQLLTACQGQELVSSASWLRFDHYQKAIALINKQIRELDGPPSDALIMAVTTLAVHGRRADKPLPECHPQSPLATQGYLHMYGQMLTEERHVQGLVELIQRKGGIAGIETYGMAETIALADIYLGTKHFQKPLLPSYWPEQSIALSERHRPDPTAVLMGSILGSGFDFLSSSSSGGILREVLTLMCDLVLALDQRIRGASGAPEVVELVPTRNMIQHRLLSMDPQNMEGEMEELIVADVCRTGTMIFSDMVTFPIPATQQIKPMFAARLRSLLESQSVYLERDTYQDVMVWLLVMGAIASTFSADHDWFLERLRMQTMPQNIPNWPTLKKQCSRFLWWPPVCDQAGRVVWSEIHALQEVKAESLAYR